MKEFFWIKQYYLHSAVPINCILKCSIVYCAIYAFFVKHAILCAVSHAIKCTMQIVRVSVTYLNVLRAGSVRVCNMS